MDGFFRFKVTLCDVTPPIWRQFDLLRDATFQDLHETIQDACGWTDSHLFSFSEPGKRGLLIAESSDGDEVDGPVAEDVPLSKYFKKVGQRCVYTYDFGDNWVHDVVCEKIDKVTADFGRHLVAGERAFPPEDCGGIYGYEQCVDLVKRSLSGSAAFNEDEEERLEWMGEWSPEQFDLEEAREDFDS